ncbi:MAG: DMT family transporter [Lentimicrobium sp.]|jgi:drug/metabolite transporter (DMT)-like permease|nr:DMT family transporter [Lentimicrobium sp.]
MIYLIFAILASTFILVTLKVFEQFKVNRFVAIALNYLVGAIFGLSYIQWDINIAQVSHSPWFYMALTTAFLLVCGFVLFSFSASKAGITLTAISSRMSVIIPVLFGLLMFGDEAGFVKISGIVLALLALILTLWGNGDKKFRLKLIFLPLLVFLFAGLNDSAVKITQALFLSNETTDYVSYAATAFVFAFILSSVVVLVIQPKTRQRINLNTLIAGVILGLLNWASIFFMLKGLNQVEVSVFIPLLNVSVVSLSTLIGYSFFKEKISLINFIGIMLAVVAILLIAYRPI